MSEVSLYYLQRWSFEIPYDFLILSFLTRKPWRHGRITAMPTASEGRAMPSVAIVNVAAELMSRKHVLLPTTQLNDEFLLSFSAETTKVDVETMRIDRLTIFTTDGEYILIKSSHANLPYR